MEAEIYSKQFQHKKAEEFMLKSLAKRRETYAGCPEGKYHKKFAKIHEKLAQVYQKDK